MPLASPRPTPAHIGYRSNVTSSVERYLHLDNNNSVQNQDIGHPSTTQGPVEATRQPSAKIVHGLRRTRSISINQDTRECQCTHPSTPSIEAQHQIKSTKDKYKHKYNRLKRSLSEVGVALHPNDKVEINDIESESKPKPKEARGTDEMIAQETLIKESSSWDLPQIQAYIKQMEKDEYDLVTRACNSPIPDQAALIAKIKSTNDLASAADATADELRPAVSAFRGSRPSTPDQMVRFDVPSSSGSGSDPSSITAEGHTLSKEPHDPMQNSTNTLTDPNDGHGITHTVYGWTTSTVQPNDTEPQQMKGQDQGQAMVHPFQLLLKKHYLPPPPPPPSPADPLLKAKVTGECDYHRAYVDLPIHSRYGNSSPAQTPEVNLKVDIDSMDDKAFAIHTLENRLSEVQNKIDLCQDQGRKRRMREIQSDLLRLMNDIVRSGDW
ncbi:hypothetical protein IAT40_003356 [Kwoniella sp. CBS 6097]